MRVVFELPDTYEAIARPVAMDITRTVGRLMHMPAATEILFVGNTGQAVQSGATLNYKGAPSKFPGATRIRVSMSESTDEPGILSENAFQENAPVCWWDKCLGVRLRPIYSSVVLTIRFEVQSRSRDEAEKVRDEYRMRTAMGRQQILHALTYHYGIPSAQFALMQLIYQMREAVAGYGDTFQTWMMNNEYKPSNAIPRLTQVSNLAGGGQAWVFGERQNSVQGIFDFHIAPEAPDKNDDDGMYTYPIEYRVRYDKPIGMSMDYPLVVHNQLLPEPYHHSSSAAGWLPDPYNHKEIYSDNTTEIFNGLILGRSLRSHRLMGGVRYPLFDDWVPSSIPANTSTIYAAIIQIDLTNPTDICDLKQLPGVTVDPDIFQYMVACGPRLGLINGSAIHVGLYQDGSWLGDDNVVVTQDLLVSSANPLSPRGRYHLRISVMNDLTLLSDSARYQLRTNGAAAQKIIMALQQSMRDAAYVPKLMGVQQVMPEATMMEAAWRINLHKRSYQTPLEVAIPRTVGTFFVTAKRMNEYAPDESRTLPTPITLPSDNPNYESLVPGDCQQPQS